MSEAAEELPRESGVRRDSLDRSKSRAVGAKGQGFASGYLHLPRGAVRAFLTVLGPAWIVMMADVDAPSVITAGESGAVYGYHLVFVLLILIVPLFFIQEASGRQVPYPRKGSAASTYATRWKSPSMFQSRPK